MIRVGGACRLGLASSKSPEFSLKWSGGVTLVWWKEFGNEVKGLRHGDLLGHLGVEIPHLRNDCCEDEIMYEVFFISHRICHTSPLVTGTPIN